MDFKTLTLNINGPIAKVTFNRPNAANALNETLWAELKTAFEYLDSNNKIRAIVLGGVGKNFCGGIDLSLLHSLLPQPHNDDDAEKETLLRAILDLQGVITKIENCTKPVIAAIQGACIGAGLDIVAACDMRYASEDAFFSIKEVDMGMVADLGSLQRLPNLLNEGMVRELAFTGRNVYAQEAKSIGLVNNVFADPISLQIETEKIAATVAEKSPRTIKGIKANMNYSRGHTVEEGLKFVAEWNATLEGAADMMEVFLAKKEGRQPQFKD